MSQDRYTTKKLAYRLLCDYMKNHIFQTFIAVIFMILVAICNAIHIHMIVPAIDEVFTNKSMKMLYFLSTAIVFVSLLKAVSEYCQAFLVKNIGQRLLTDIQIDLYNHLLMSDLTTINDLSSAKIISRFTNDISMMRSAINNLALGTTKHLFSVLALVFVMYQLDPGITLVSILVFPIAIYPIILIGKKIRVLSHETQEELGNYTSNLDRNFSNVKIIKSYVNEKYESRRSKNLLEHIFTLYRKLNKFDSLNSPIVEFISGLMMAFIFIYGGSKVISGEVTTGTFFAFLTAFISSYRPFKSLVRLNMNIQEIFTATKRIYQVLDIEPKIIDNDSAKALDLGDGDIKIDDVSLSFGSRVALKNISLEISGNKTTAIVGVSGSGKTSVANLLVRFYDPNKGSVSINGQDLKSVKIGSLRSKIALVTQDNIIFDSEIRENISYGNQKASDQDIINIAKHAKIHDFISKLPLGYNTTAGACGDDLSGSQKQLIAISRALIKDADILIFDEATSALDQKKEMEIKNSLRKLRSKKTNIIIAHRLSSIIDADKIIVMNAGKVVEEGTHQELLDLKNHYYNLYNAQNINLE